MSCDYSVIIIVLACFYEVPEQTEECSLGTYRPAALVIRYIIDEHLDQTLGKDIRPAGILEGRQSGWATEDLGELGQ